MNEGKIYASSECKECSAKLLSFEEIKSQMVIYGRFDKGMKGGLRK